MIPITIAEKKYKIKAISELTTAEFIELSKIENLDMMKYIAWQTNTSMDTAFFAVISKNVEKAIGTMPDITKLPKSKWFDYSKTIQTVGQRHQIESCNLSGMDLLVFVLAVSQARSNNIDDVNDLVAQYMQQPFTQILPSGFFFMKTLTNGNSYGPKYFRTIKALIRMDNLRSRRALRK